MIEKYPIWIRIFAKLFKKWISIITESHELEIAKLKEMVAHDSLTGALSRKEFKERVAHILFLLKRNGADHYFSIVFIDIDKFKDINDEYGHEGGDNILKNLVCYLESHLRESDFVGRFGGDEFALFLGESNMKFGIKVVEKIKSALAHDKLSTGNEEIQVGISCGIASTSEDINEIQELLRKADQRMYKVKRSKNSG